VKIKDYELGPDVDLDVEVVLDADGSRITEARAQEIAEESVAEYYAGRPSLSTPRQQSPELKARVPVELRDRVQEEAKRRGITQSELLREALEQFLAS
jgi:hypothetical protein